MARLDAGEAHAGEFGRNAVIITPTLVVDTAIYAALDIIGGELTLTNAMRVSGGSGILQAVTVIDDDNEKAAIDILLFNSPLTGTKADQGALSYSAADPAKILGRISVLNADYLTYVAASLAVAQIRGINLPVAASGSANLYAIILAVATPTYTATTDLMVKFHFERN